MWLGAAALWCTSVSYRFVLDPRYQGRTHLANACQGLSVAAVLVTAYVLARRQPENRMWWLTMWFGLAGLLQDLVGPNRVALAVGLVCFQLPAVFLVWLSLAFPTGRVTGRLDRVILGWVVAIASVSALHLFDEGGHGPGTHRWVSPLYFRDFPMRWDQIETIALDLSVPGGVLFLGRLVARTVRARGGPKRVSVPLLVAATGATLWFLAQVPFAGEFSFRVTDEIVRNFFWISLVIQASIPIAFAAGALAQRWNRAIVGQLLVDLDGAQPGSVEPALGRALGDPALQVLLRRPDGSGYVQPDGEPVAWDPSALPPTRSWTVIAGRDADVGVLVYDAELDVQPDLVRSTLAAARFALENERLHADLQAQMNELRASRARVVEASDAERRRIERNLHDGVQQRLYAVGMELDAARHALLDGADDAAARRRLEEADAALRTAIEDLRDVAQGIDPPVLTNRGLEAALRSRTRRSSVPVVLTTTLTERLSAPIETAAYYVASEAFTNAERHAGATRIAIELRTEGHELVVTVADDGVGGADASKGTGLRGLLDRAQAFDGTLTVHSPTGGGTRVEVRLPVS